MFDQHHYHRHDTTHRTTITEQRAPTDESVRILRDMEDRSEKKVLAADGLPTQRAVVPSHPASASAGLTTKGTKWHAQ